MGGFLRGWLSRRSSERASPVDSAAVRVMQVGFPAVVFLALALWGWPVALPATLLTLLLLVRSIRNFSRTGPQLREEVVRHYRGYTLGALVRLLAWAFVLTLAMSAYGVLAFGGLSLLLAPPPLSSWRTAATGAVGVAAVVALQFCRHLLWMPGSIAASSSYLMTRFHAVWHLLTPLRLHIAAIVLGTLLATGTSILAAAFLRDGDARSAAITVLSAVLLAALTAAGAWQEEARAVHQPIEPGTGRMNVLMIGADTLRADRLGMEGYGRALTPTLDALAASGICLAQCFIPCGRTAPSLASLLTGTWPHTHGIRDNFALPSEFSTRVPILTKALTDAGYETIAISDWAGADLGKYPFGFERRLLPGDQWNIKYLIRQGPKDIRLFLSLFTHSRFGRRFLPELYYLAGVPMTDELGRDTRRLISECAASRQPFFINAFFSTTHAPFASEHPYYTLFSGRDYAGPSKFVMGLMNDPFEIIKQQRHTVADVDLDQIHALYDGCVRRFDDEVKRILDHLEACGLREQTIVVIYSDHGIEFFERDSWGQGNSVIVDGSSRIPVIIADPRRKTAVRVDEVTRSIDVAPTVLDLLGLPIPAGMEGVSLKNRADGRVDRLDLMAFEETGIWFTRVPGMPEGHLHYPELPALLEIPEIAQGTLAVKPEYREVVIRAKDRSVRSASWKLAYMPMESGVPKVMLFDLENDQSCEHDVSEQHQDRLRQLLTELATWASSRELQPCGTDPSEGGHHLAAPSDPQAVDRISASIIEERP